MIACALCVGASPEPYLSATLASIADACDLLVVNDNSGEARSANLDVIDRSAFARDRRLRVVATKFVDFAQMRNEAFAALAAVASPEWVLWLDADEVHDVGIAPLTRGFLPHLGERYASVDGYTDHLVGTFDWMSDVARRLCAYRFDPALRWRNAVHEKLEGMRGAAFVLPYRYVHYGNVLPPALYARKDLRYAELGNVVDYIPPTVADASVANVYERRRDTVRKFTRTHPPAAATTVAALRGEYAPTFAEIDHLFARQTIGSRLNNAVRGVNEELRVALRYLEHPGAWPIRP